MNVKKLSLPGIEPGTLSVLDSHDNHYTTGTTIQSTAALLITNNIYLLADDVKNTLRCDPVKQLTYVHYHIATTKQKAGQK